MSVGGDIKEFFSCDETWLHSLSSGLMRLLSAERFISKSFSAIDFLCWGKDNEALTLSKGVSFKFGVLLDY